MNDKTGIAHSLATLGEVAAAHGDFATAGRLYREALALHRALGNRLMVIERLEMLAQLAVTSGAGGEETRRAAQLWGAAEALRATLGAPLPG